MSLLDEGLLFEIASTRDCQSWEAAAMSLDSFFAQYPERATARESLAVHALMSYAVCPPPTPLQHILRLCAQFCPAALPPMAEKLDGSTTMQQMEVLTALQRKYGLVITGEMTMTSNNDFVSGGAASSSAAHHHQQQHGSQEDPLAHVLLQNRVLHAENDALKNQLREHKPDEVERALIVHEKIVSQLYKCLAALEATKAERNDLREKVRHLRDELEIAKNNNAAGSGGSFNKRRVGGVSGQNGVATSHHDDGGATSTSGGADSKKVELVVGASTELQEEVDDLKQRCATLKAQLGKSTAEQHAVIAAYSEKLQASEAHCDELQGELHETLVRFSSAERRRKEGQVECGVQCSDKDVARVVRQRRQFYDVVAAAIEANKKKNSIGDDETNTKSHTDTTAAGAGAGTGSGASSSSSAAQQIFSSATFDRLRSSTKPCASSSSSSVAVVTIDDLQAAHDQTAAGTTTTTTTAVGGEAAKSHRNAGVPIGTTGDEENDDDDLDLLDDLSWRKDMKEQLKAAQTEAREAKAMSVLLTKHVAALRKRLGNATAMLQSE